MAFSLKKVFNRVTIGSAFVVLGLGMGADGLIKSSSASTAGLAVAFEAAVESKKQPTIDQAAAYIRQKHADSETTTGAFLASAAASAVGSGLSRREKKTP